MSPARRRAVRVALVVCLLVASAVALPPSTASAPASPPAVAAAPVADGAAASDGDVGIATLYPNPVARGDAGEYAVVSLPTTGNWSVSDGEANVTLPSDAVGRVAVGGDPAAVRNHTDAATPVVEAPGSFALANGGERIALRRDGRVVDAVRYADAPADERWLADADPHWRPVGLVPRDVHAAGPATARAFVLPDSPGEPVVALHGADRRVLLAGYTFASRRVADALIAAAERGVRVRVLVDGAPVGGVPRAERRALDRLVAAGVEVRALGGPRARFDYHHPKYAVVDDAALVLTENWKPSGVGGRENRGWGVRVDSAATAAALAAVFDHDAGWRDARPWARIRGDSAADGDGDRGFSGDADSFGGDGESYPSRIDPTTASVERVRLLTAPGNAEAAVVRAIDGADERVDVLQPTVGGRNHPMLRAAVRAARRGVAVRVLLSNAWYVEAENRALVAWLNRVADRDGLPLDARIADPDGRYGKVHAKGVVADDTAIVGSLNWNDNAAHENREVAVALTGSEVAGYYRDAFAADWVASGDDGDGWGLGWRGADVPAGLLGAAGAAALAAMAYARRRVSFDSGGETDAVGFGFDFDGRDGDQGQDRDREPEAAEDSERVRDPDARPNRPRERE